MKIVLNALLGAAMMLVSFAASAQIPDSALPANPPLLRTQTTPCADSRCIGTQGFILNNVPNAASVDGTTGRLTLTTPGGSSITTAASIKGATGATGATGPQGPAGTNGTTITQGTLSSRPAASTAGNLYYATDAAQLFRDTGSAWQLANNTTAGVAAGRPAFGVAGRFYVATDTGALSYDSGTAWVAVSNATDLSGYATLNAPALTGNATALTQAYGEATARIATDAFVHANAASQFPNSTIILDAVSTISAATYPPSGTAIVWANDTQQWYAWIQHTATIASNTSGSTTLVVSGTSHLFKDGAGYKAGDIITAANAAIPAGTTIVGTPTVSGGNTTIIMSAASVTAATGTVTIGRYDLSGNTSTTQAYGDNSSKIATTSYVNQGFVSQFQNNPIKWGTYTTISSAPAPVLGESALVKVNDVDKIFQFETYTATVATTQTAVGTAISVTTSTISPDPPGGLKAGDFVLSAILATPKVPLQTKIATTPAINGSNTDITLSASTAAVLNAGDVVTFGRYREQVVSASTVDGTNGPVPVSALPIASSTTAGVLYKVDPTYLRNSPAVGLTCIYGKCPAVDGVTVAAVGGPISPVIKAVKPGPVCSNTGITGESVGGTVGNQYVTRRMYYCPQGATQVQFHFSSVYASGSPIVETNPGTPVVRNISIETNAPPPWRSGIAYATGARVTYGPTNATSAVSGATAASYAYNPNFVALQAVPAGTIPSPVNSSYWGPDAAAVPVPVTCGGKRTCIQPADINMSGVLETRDLDTDTIPVAIPVGGWIAVRDKVVAPNGTMAFGNIQHITSGAYLSSGSNVNDITLSGTRLASNNGQAVGLYAITGIPLNPTPSVCIAGGSRSVGVGGNGVSGVSVSAGGTGYNVGDIIFPTNTSAAVPASANNTIVTARFIVQTTTAGGVVSTIGTIYPGHYAVPSSGGQTTTNPSGVTPTTTTGSGTGLTINLSGMSAIAGIYEDQQYLGDGSLQSALSRAGIPWASFARSGDQVSTWATQGGSLGRLAMIAKTGCTSFIDALDFNDAGASIAASDTMANHVTVANAVRALGVRGTYLTTTPPGANSSDSFLTATNQSTYTSSSIIAATNLLKLAAAVQYAPGVLASDQTSNTSMVLTGTGLGLVSGLVLTGDSIAGGTTITGTPTEASGNTTITLSAATSSLVVAGAQIGIANTQPFDGIIDLASVVEVNASNVLTRGGGRFLANNTNTNYCTPDGTHFTPVCYELQAAVAQAFAPNFK